MSRTEYISVKVSRCYYEVQVALFSFRAANHCARCNEPCDGDEKGIAEVLEINSGAVSPETPRGRAVVEAARRALAEEHNAEVLCESCQREVEARERGAGHMMHYCTATGGWGCYETDDGRIY